jgi:Cu/Ag efflux pump CusA
MIAKLIGWSLANRLIVLAMAAVVLIGGTMVAVKMPVDVFPDLTAPSVTIITEAHGMAPEEVETLVTFPIETAVNGAAGVRRVRSSTATGISVIWVEFDWGTDIYQARQVVSEKLQLAGSNLPPEAERPVLAPISSIMGEIMFISLTSQKHRLWSCALRRIG